jgi:aspartate oxidase
MRRPQSKAGYDLTLEVSISLTSNILTTHNSNKRQTSTAQAGFESTVSAGERPQTHALDRAATGLGNDFTYINQIQNPELDLKS